MTSPLPISAPLALLSVILPVYEVPIAWLDLAIESILNQTYTKFELIIINDNPKDSILKRALWEYKKKDTRIILIENKVNLGLPLSLNKAIAIAKGKYIARMDADDIALPQRLQKQYNFLEKHSTISLCGTQAFKITHNEKIITTTKNALSPDLIHRLSAYQNPTTHPTWMIRKIDLIEIGLYNKLPNAEDYELLMRLLIAGKKIANLSDILLKYRMHQHSQSGKKSLEQKLCIQYIQNFYHSKNKQQNLSFNTQLLQNYLQKQLPSKISTSNNLYHARLNEANLFLKLIFIFKAFINSSIERHYLLNLLKARVVKIKYFLFAK